MRCDHCLRHMGRSCFVCEAVQHAGMGTHVVTHALRNVGSLDDEALEEIGGAALQAAARLRRIAMQFRKESAARRKSQAQTITANKRSKAA